MKLPEFKASRSLIWTCLNINDPGYMVKQVIHQDKDWSWVIIYTRSLHAISIEAKIEHRSGVSIRDIHIAQELYIGNEDTKQIFDALCIKAISEIVKSLCLKCYKRKTRK